MYPIVSTLTDCASAFPGYLYLPGESVPALAGHTSFMPYEGTQCVYCDRPMGWRGTTDPTTGGEVPQSPSTGDHDGIVSGIYAPVEGARPMESDYAHLRCVCDAAEVGTVTLTMGTFDPYTWARTTRYEPKRARWTA